MKRVLKYFESGRRQIFFGIVAVLSLFVILGSIKYLQILSAMAGQQSGPPPETVTTLVVKKLTWQRTLNAVGSLIPSQGVTLSAEVSGKVSKILFESGQGVSAGDVLLELDTSVEEAELKGAEATLKRAADDFERAKILRKKSAMSEADYDLANAGAIEASARVATLKATIERKRIIAPFPGRTGIRKVNLGEYLTPGREVVPLHVLDPLFANFSLPQRDFNLVTVGQKVRLSLEGIPTEIEGALSAKNPQIDPSTRLFEIQATIPNPEEKLRPGMFARVELILPESDSVIAIPTSSISYAPYGDMVWILEKSPSAPESPHFNVRQQVVVLGAKRGDQVAIMSGLKEGDEIVTSGTFKLRPGATVMVRNEFAPKNDPAPKPEES